MSKKEAKHFDFNAEITRIENFFGDDYGKAEEYIRKHTEDARKAFMCYNCPKCGERGTPFFKGKPCSSLTCTKGHYWHAAKNKLIKEDECADTEEAYYPPEVFQEIQKFRCAARSKGAFALGYAFEKACKLQSPELKSAYAMAPQVPGARPP